MPALIVGALAVELGLDTAKFEQSLKSLPGVAGTHLNAMSAEMKRTSREGAESFRIVEEALGIHISRPIAKILSETFPGFAKAFQSLLGAGITVAVGLAAIEAISKAVEALTKKFEEAKRAQEEYEAASRHLSDTLQEVAVSHEKRLLQLNAELAALSGDKQGELANRIKIASIEDADLAIQQINQIAEAMDRASKAAIEAESASHRFWLGIRGGFESEHNLGIENASKQFEDFKSKLKEAQQTDAAKGTHEGLDLAIQKAAELDQRLSEMQQRRISDFKAFADDLAKGLGKNFDPFFAVSPRSGFTDKEISVARVQAEEAHRFLDVQKQVTEEHQKHLQLLNAQNRTQEEIGSKEIEKLKADTDAQLALAQATAGSIAQQRLQQAAGEADQLISRILEEAHGRLTARIREEMSAVHALTAERQLARDAIATNQDLQKAITAITQQIDSQTRLAQAYRESGDAILAANVEAKLQPQIKAAADLREEYERLKKAADDYASSIAKLAGAPGPPQGIKGISPEALAIAKAKSEEADQRVEELRTKAIVEARQKYQTEIEQNDAAIRGEAPLLAALDAAYQQNAEAVRRAQVALALFHWEQAHPGADASQIQATRVQLEQQSIQQQRIADAELASRYSLNYTYDATISKLQRTREIMQQYGHDTLLIDAAIQDAEAQYLRQWDDAAFKVGTFEQKYKAVMNEVIIRGKEASAEMARSWLSAIDEVNTNLAKLLTGQKTDFKAVIQNLAEQNTKATLEKFEGSIAAHIPGLGSLADVLKGKPDGSKGNPLFVSIVGASDGGGGLFDEHGGLPNRLSEQGGTQQAGFSDVLNSSWGVLGPGGLSERIRQMNAAGNSIDPSTGMSWNSILQGAGLLKKGESFGDVFSGFLSFGGFRAAGGDVWPGRDYMVGEQGPELLRIPHAGTIISNADMRSLSTVHRGGDVKHGPVVNQTFNGVKDTDQFRRTTRQELARMLRHVR